MDFLLNFFLGILETILSNWALRLFVIFSVLGMLIVLALFPETKTWGSRLAASISLFTITTIMTLLLANFASTPITIILGLLLMLGTFGAIFTRI